VKILLIGGMIFHFGVEKGKRKRKWIIGAHRIISAGTVPICGGLAKPPQQNRR
jgi:hypothetical protein